MAATTQPLSRTDAASYIRSRSAQLGIDPNAALAVAQQEGWGGGIGDNGTSFGPWQLHVGGAFPSSVQGQPTSSWTSSQKQSWAWSKGGIDYALSRIASVAKGQQGSQAIDSIVTRFERPANPGAEVLGATAAYGVPVSLGGSGPDLTSQPGRPGVPGGGGDGFWGSVTGELGTVGGYLDKTLIDPWGNVISAAEGGVNSTVDFFKALVWLTLPSTWLRVVEGLFGFVLILAGIGVMLKVDQVADKLPAAIPVE